MSVKTTVHSAHLDMDALEMTTKVPISGAIWKVVAKVGSVDTDSFSVGEDSHIFCDHFSVTKARPPSPISKS